MVTDDNNKDGERMVVDIEYYGKRKFKDILDIYEWSKEWEEICAKLRRSNYNLSKIVLVKKEY